MRWAWGMAAGAALLLVACQGPSGPKPPSVDRDAPTFSLRLVPAPLELAVGESAVVTVTVLRSEGFDAPVTVRVAPGTAPPTGMEVGQVTLAAGATAGTLALTVDERVAPGTVLLTLQGVGGGVTKFVAHAVVVRAPVAEVASSTIDGDADAGQLRLGQTDVLVVLQGRRLDRVTTVAMEDLDVTISSDPPRTDELLALRVQVPHGAPRGPRALTLGHGAFGGLTLHDFVEVTPIVVGPAGDDAAGRGTWARPFRSLTRALQVAGDDDLVWLDDGRYDEAGGEAWGSQDWDATFPPEALPPANVPERVTIRGQSRDGVVLAGSFLHGGAQLGLVFAGAGSLERVTLTDFATAVVATGGPLALRDVRLWANSEGVLALLDADVTIEHALLDAQYHDALRPRHSARMAVRDSVLSDNLWALTADGDVRVDLEDVYVRDSGLDGLRLLDRSHAVLRRVTVEGSALAGIRAAGHALVMRDSAVLANGESGLLVRDGVELVDLGNLLEAGANALAGNLPYQIHDTRADRDEFDGVIVTLSATTLQGAWPEPGGLAGPLVDGDRIAIDGARNRIEIY